MRYICVNCGYVYDEKQGDIHNQIPAGTIFDTLPDDWVCPICYVAKSHFDSFDASVS